MAKGLSIEQEKAAKMIASGITEKLIADKLKIKLAVLKTWTQNLNFKLKVMQSFEIIIDLERTVRFDRVNKFLKPIYSEIRTKLRSKEGLKNVSLKDLLRMMSALQAELRADSNFDKRYIRAAEKDGGLIDNFEDDEDDEISLDEVRKSYKQHREDSSGKNKIVSISR
uniref:Uncharacterized protein n=1 Tax=viral metagenome TaxID=1070528 RepID=A0A6M3K083_9ZZZZ